MGTQVSCLWQAVAPKDMVQEWRDIFFKLADLAKIKGDREVFYMAGCWQSVLLAQSWIDRDDLADEVFLAAGDAIRRAADAVSALNENQKKRVGEFFYKFINRDAVTRTKKEPELITNPIWVIGPFYFPNWQMRFPWWRGNSRDTNPAWA